MVLTQQLSASNCSGADFPTPARPFRFRDVTSLLACFARVRFTYSIFSLTSDRPGRSHEAPFPLRADTSRTRQASHVRACPGLQEPRTSAGNHARSPTCLVGFQRAHPRGQGRDELLSTSVAQSGHVFVSRSQSADSRHYRASSAPLSARKPPSGLAAKAGRRRRGDAALPGNAMAAARP